MYPTDQIDYPLSATFFDLERASSSFISPADHIPHLSPNQYRRRSLHDTVVATIAAPNQWDTFQGVQDSPDDFSTEAMPDSSLWEPYRDVFEDQDSQSIMDPVPVSCHTADGHDQLETLDNSHTMNSAVGLTFPE